jgi:hypothetical protein
MAILEQLFLAPGLVSVALATLLQPGLSYNDFQVGSRSPIDDTISVFPQTVFIPWVAPFSRLSTYTPSIRADISGKTFNLPVGTNTTGVLIGAPLLTNIKLTKQNPPGWQFLENSQILYSGQLVDLNITFNGAQKGERAISRVPVLIVTKVVKCPGYNVYKDNGVCPSNKLNTKEVIDPAKVMYMGVGFGRNLLGSGFSYGTPPYNPFLNVVGISNYPVLSIRTGYTISTQGVYLGLTDTNTAGAQWIQLEKMAGTDARSWALPPVSFSYDNSNNAVQARALFDISITEMYIQSTPSFPLPNVTIRNTDPRASTVKSVKPGTRLSFAFPDRSKGVAGYEFVVGDTKFPSQPSYVVPITSGTGPSVNTGRNFFYGFSVVFDAATGRCGLICEMCKGSANG